MPGRYTSARFVGREEAFARLAAALDDAARRAARARCSIGGSPGVGVTPLPRRGDRPDRRHCAEPMTVLRGGAWPGGDDEPYGAAHPGHRPGAARRCRRADLARRSSARPRTEVRPPPARPRPAARRGGRRAAAASRCATAPERRQARTLGGHPRAARAARRSASRSCSSSRTSIAPTPRPGRSSPSWPGSRGTQRLAIVVTHQPDVVIARRPMGRRSRRARRGPAADRAPDRSRRSDRDELAALIEGIEGERAVGQPAAARRRALRRHAARRRGAAGGPPRAAEGLADRLVRRPGHGPARRPIAGVPPGPAPARAGRSPADRRPSSRRSAAAFEAETPAARPRDRRAGRGAATASSTRT